MDTSSSRSPDPNDIADCETSSFEEPDAEEYREFLVKLFELALEADEEEVIYSDGSFLECLAEVGLDSAKVATTRRRTGNKTVTTRT